MKIKITSITSIFIACLLGFPSLSDLFSSEKNTWKIENIQLNNNTANAIEITPGKEINISLDIKIWNTKQCDNCSKQIVLILNDQKLDCIYEDNSNIQKQDFITIQKKIISPHKPGEYILYALLYEEQSCETAIMRSNNSIDKEKLASFNEKIMIMHPGPVNEEIELSHEIVHSNHSLISKQVENGVHIRQKIIERLLENE